MGASLFQVVVESTIDISDYIEDYFDFNFHNFESARRRARYIGLEDGNPVARGLHRHEVVTILIMRYLERRQRTKGEILP
jgi:hypothetical protein